jgi:hypothetical protein
MLFVSIYSPTSSGQAEGPRRPQGESLSRRSEPDDSDSQVQCLICGQWFHAITFTHLKFRHGINRPREYKEEFGLSNITSPEVRRRIAQQKVLVDRHAVGYIRRHWGKKSLYEMVRYLGINASTIRAHARRMGLGLLVERWDLGKILRGLRKAHRLGTPLNSGHARKHLGQLYKAAIQYCGSWKRALAEAGISYEKVARRSALESWSRERIIAEIRELRLQGKDLDYAFLQARWAKLYAAARNHFGSWRAARQAASLQERKRSP